MDARCNVFWGSHGCTLPPGHDGPIHQCGPEFEGDVICSQCKPRGHDPKPGGKIRASVRLMNQGTGEWLDWDKRWHAYALRDDAA